jgi:N-methylhydantoinase B
MISRYGRESVLSSMAWTIDYAERRFAAEVTNWPAGTSEGICVLPDDGHSRRDLAVRATVRVGDGRVDIDLSAADPQSNGFVNCTPATAHGFALLPILSAVDETVPKNAGILRRVGLTTAKGTVVDPIFPAPTGWSLHHAGAEVAGAVAEALAAILPARAASVSVSLPLLRTIGRTVRHGGTIEQVSVRDYGSFGQGGCSGASGRDGWGMPGVFAESPLPSVELYEAAVGDQIAKLELVTDSGGPGRWRGGLGTETVIVLSSNGEDTFLSAAPQVGASAGFARGKAGTPNALVLRDGAREEAVDQVLVDTPVAAGTQVTLRLAGGAGWGSPWERSPESVLADVLDGYVSVDAARREYGVVIDPRTGSVDDKATQAERKARAS